ncbi:hypothetical protein CSA56_12045 [candidate division KSB3 bacterium]|uniref:PilZ domain-containing protein n=1 Tax=candidate division KSB3 bacterium TaxID=2044937 RepID=A0A2G6KCJ5_9BACT|nr:MAG: hypothetical protein CSA56_12045 [candidate division KSB3 bacterium]
MKVVEERREYPRFKAPICYRSAPFFSSRRPLIDFGLGGIRIYSNDRIKIGKRLEVELLLPNNDEALTFLAKVAWLKELPKEDTAMYDIGLQFLHTAESQLQPLINVLKEYTESEDKK